MRGVDLNHSPALIPRKLLIPRYAKAAQWARKANLFYTFLTLCLWSELSRFVAISYWPPTPRLATQLCARIIWVSLFPLKQSDHIKIRCRTSMPMEEAYLPVIGRGVQQLKINFGIATFGESSSDCHLPNGSECLRGAFVRQLRFDRQ